MDSDALKKLQDAVQRNKGVQLSAAEAWEIAALYKLQCDRYDLERRKRQKLEQQK